MSERIDKAIFWACMILAANNVAVMIYVAIVF